MEEQNHYVRSVQRNEVHRTLNAAANVTNHAKNRRRCSLKKERLLATVSIAIPTSH